MKKHTKKHSGFTIIELMVVLVIVGIVVGVGVPSFKTMLQNNRLIAAPNELLSALHVARAEAIKNNVRVTICDSNDGTSCTNTGKWEDGWIVFIDANGNRAGTGLPCAAANTDCLLRVQDGFNDSELTIAGLHDSTGAPIQFFTFSSRGLPKNTGGTPQSGIFSLCSGNGERGVVLSLSGRARITTNAAVITC